MAPAGGLAANSTDCWRRHQGSLGKWRWKCLAARRRSANHRPRRTRSGKRSDSNLRVLKKCQRIWAQGNIGRCAGFIVSRRPGFNPVGVGIHLGCFPG